MRGVTLVELVIVMIVVAILASVVALSYQSNDVKARYQAERLRTDLRHAQMLATTLNRPLLFAITAGLGGSYSVSRLDNATCAASALTDPATNDPFAVTLDSAVTLTGTASFYLDYMGRPAIACAVVSAACICTTAVANPAASYTVAGGSASYAVQVRPVSGFVTVTP
jgi:prepilin-type N-terminal cleavage/methylation domain-containing protein